MRLQYTQLVTTLCSALQLVECRQQATGKQGHRESVTPVQILSKECINIAARCGLSSCRVDLTNVLQDIQEAQIADVSQPM